MRVLLETEHLLLREFTAEDLDDLVALDADPEVSATSPAGGRPRTRDPR
jgi:RimJ/RimL family protein N-acetyltransferase